MYTSITSIPISGNLSEIGYKQVPIHCVLFSATFTGDLLASIKKSKYKFYSELSNNIQFEYSVVPPLLTLSKKDALLLNIEPKIIDPLSNEKVTKLFINNDFNVFIQQAIDLEKEKDKFSMNTKLKINNTIKDVKITVQVIYDGEEVLGILGDIEIL